MLRSTARRTVRDPLQALFLLVFLGATPFCATFVFLLGAGKDEPEASRAFWVRFLTPLLSAGAGLYGRASALSLTTAT